MTQLNSNLAYASPLLSKGTPQAQVVRFQGEAPPVKETPKEAPATEKPLPKNFILRAFSQIARWTKDLIAGFVKDLKILWNNFKDLLKGPPEHNHDEPGHVHGPGCNHDHGHEEKAHVHVHGPGCNHDHGPKPETVKPPAIKGEAKERTHGPDHECCGGCDHDHGDKPTTVSLPVCEPAGAKHHHKHKELIPVKKDDAK